jgi:hypothetical protein
LIPSPSPDFLWNLVALANFMRLSLLKGARAASSSAAWQEIRVRGWAEVLATGPPGLAPIAIFAVSSASQLATDKPTAPDDKQKASSAVGSHSSPTARRGRQNRA